MLSFWASFWQRFFSQKPVPPPVIDAPTEIELKRWSSSHWVEYQAWLFHHSFLTLHDWQQLREQALAWTEPPLISVITPVFNTPPAWLQACIYSVQTQAYPNWEMCLVNDGSDDLETMAKLAELAAANPRLRVQHLAENQGICQATNQAIAMATGDYVVFLDHDDRLAPEALYYVAKKVLENPETDIVYSDRDTLSPDGLRFLHLFKPDWSPETLLSGNYLFHLVGYRREFLRQLSGVRVGFEGSQDYDLLLRAAEQQPQVQHIPRVLYHWRQHGQSVALEQNAKEYVYTAGVRALQESLQRQGLSAQVTENNELWRGHYRIHFSPATAFDYKILPIETCDHYAQRVNQQFEKNKNLEFLVILAPGMVPLNKEALIELIAWLQLPAVGIVTGKVIDKQGQLLHAGLVQRATGIPLAVYSGFPENTPGYMAVTAIVRNVSTPHPFCCALKREVWQQMGGLNPAYVGAYALFDFAVRALIAGHRVVYTPHARFQASEWQLFENDSISDRERFVTQWTSWLQTGDPYYSRYLTLELVDMGLNLNLNGE